MKKTFCSAVMLFAMLHTSAQSQRITLIEDFEQASCGPCASVNPGFNALMDANLTKVVKVTYEVYWPGVDPMYSQNTTESTARVNYYSVNYVPYGRKDGNSIFSPWTITQQSIDSAVAIPSDFVISVSHSFNAALDSVFISGIITCTQNTSLSAPVLHCVMVEDHIHFAVAPGTSGQKDFYDVMRKMYPGPAGTALPQTWTNGQTLSFSFAEKIPTYI